MSPGITAIAGFDADDGYDHLRIDTEFLLGTLKNVGVLFPERNTAIDPAAGEKDFSIFKPGLCFLGRPAHQFEDVFPALGLAEQAFQFSPVEIMLLHHLIDKGAGLLVVAVVWPLGLGLDRGATSQCGCEHGKD